MRRRTFELEMLQHLACATGRAQRVWQQTTHGSGSERRASGAFFGLASIVSYKIVSAARGDGSDALSKQVLQVRHVAASPRNRGMSLFDTAQFI